jgi:hypothetical protein
MRAGATESTDPGSADLDVTALASSVNAGRSPFISALRGAVALRDLTLSANPAAERLFFMSLDSATRGGRAGREDVIEANVLESGVSFGRGASWVFMPSTALSSNGFRAWSPGSAKGLRDLLSGLEHQVGRGLGALPALRWWRSRALSAAEGRHGKSRLRDLAEILIQYPILTAPAAADLIGVTTRTGLNLLGEAEEAGIVKLVTPRRSYRAWAATPMAERIRGRASVQTGARRDPFRKSPDTDDPPGATETASVSAPLSRDAEKEARALEELDAAMDAADRVLERIGRNRQEDDTGP